MPNEQEPGKTPETASVSVNGSPAGEITAEPTVTVPEVKQEQPQNSSEVEEWRKKAEEAEKKANQAQMRANQLENERKAEQQKKAEEDGNWKELYEQTQAELKAKAEREEAAKAEAEAKGLRDSVVDSYPDEKVKKVAKALLAQNDAYFYWSGDVASEEDAKAQVKAHLDALASEFGTPQAPEQHPTIDANNPVEGRDSTPGESQEALAKRLENVRF